MLEARKVSQEVGKSIPWKFVELRTWWWLGGFFKKDWNLVGLGNIIFPVSIYTSHSVTGSAVGVQCGSPARISARDFVSQEARKGRWRCGREETVSPRGFRERAAQSDPAPAQHGTDTQGPSRGAIWETVCASDAATTSSRTTCSLAMSRITL